MDTQLPASVLVPLSNIVLQSLDTITEWRK